MIHGHGGNIYEIAKTLGCSAREILDMSSNVSPVGMPSGLGDVLSERCDEIISLPEVDSKGLRASFAASVGLKDDHVLAGNGTTEFIYTIPPALKAKKALIVGPTYSDYADACRAYGVETSFLLAREEEGFRPDIDEIPAGLDNVDTVFICNPNNPTGQLVPAAALKRIIEACPGVRFVVDESYLPFVPNWEAETLAGVAADNLIVLHSFSKIFAIPGLRLGFLIAAPDVINVFRPFKQPWSVNRLAQAAGSFLVSQQAFVEGVAQFVQKERKAFLGYLETLDTLTPFPGPVHFILFRLNGELRAPELFNLMAEHKILIRDCSNFYGLSDRFVRIALKTPEANKMCADILISALSRQ
ncbi:MAG: threonine-phosphate decarboxylase [Desulfobacterales bacterium]|nr:threonine-phosphate decarboxylase [Desulfobacterales bacterium]